MADFTSRNRPNATVTDDDVREIIRGIQKVMARTGEEWVPWRYVAKECKGSEEYADLLMSIASLDQWRRFFLCPAKKGSVVKLTFDGVQFAAAAAPPKLSEIGSIAAAVRGYASRLRRIGLTVKSVARVAQVQGKTVQAIAVDAADEAVASETPCEFRSKAGGLTRGRIIGQEPDGAVLYVAFDSEVTLASLPGILSIDRAFLLQQLSERLRQLREVPQMMAPALRPTKATSISVAGDDSLAVARELAQLGTPWTRFLWGPPGAGKTFGLGYLVSLLQQLEPNGRTLIVAPSNRAVDVALEQTIAPLSGSLSNHLIADRRVLRYGYPRKSNLLGRPELLGPPELDELSRKVRTLSERISRLEREERGASDIAVLRAEQLAAQEAVKNAVTAHVKECAIVATTTTLAYLPTSPIAECVWDNVIVDEVTMVTPAMCTFLASLAKKRFLLAGDPRQLGPVYEGNPHGEDRNSYEWMGRDIFDKSGIAGGEGETRTVALDDTRLARITCQRRCAAPIWSRVAYLYPKVENHSDSQRSDELVQVPPLSGSSVVLLDTSRCGELARCERDHSSWQNPFTSDVAIQVVRSIAAGASSRLSIAIISPYRAQVRLLRQQLRQESRATNSPWAIHEIDAGTVHQFQGSDADVIIFDMVDGPGRPHVGNLLKGDAGLRLVNVAFTRAKGKLVVIADADWCGAFLDRETNALLYEMVVGRNAAERVIVHRSTGGVTGKRMAAAKAAELLTSSLGKASISAELAKAHHLRGKDGATLACADVAFPTHQHAIFIDGVEELDAAKVWYADTQHRHKLQDIGWTFSVLRAIDVRENTAECVNQIRETLRGARKETPPHVATR